MAESSTSRPSPMEVVNRRLANEPGEAKDYDDEAAETLRTRLLRMFLGRA